MKKIFQKNIMVTLWLVVTCVPMIESTSSNGHIFGNEEHSEEKIPGIYGDLDKFKSDLAKLLTQKERNFLKHFATNTKRMSHTTKSNECSEPSEEYLELELAEYQKTFRKLEEQNYRFPTVNKNNNNNNKAHSTNDLSIKHIMSNSKLIDDSQCNMDNRNTTSPNKRSICPWKYVLAHSDELYPKTKIMAKCTCSSCTKLENDPLPTLVYKCMPVLKIVPVLKRTECVNGYFNYVPHTDEVSVACMCGLIHNYTPTG